MSAKTEQWIVRAAMKWYYEHTGAIAERCKTNLMKACAAHAKQPKRR